MNEAFAKFLSLAGCGSAMDHANLIIEARDTAASCFCMQRWEGGYVPCQYNLRIEVQNRKYWIRLS